MKNLNFCIGLPRSGSTLLMNILQQHPGLFTSSTCPTSYLLDSAKNTASTISEFIAMDQDKLSNSLKEFIRCGLDGWFSALTNKPNVISKNRSWDYNLNFLFSIYKTPKFIVCLRDLRDIICSFEKLIQKYPLWNIGPRDTPFNTFTFEKRMELYCTDTSANLGRPLYFLPHVFEWMQKRPECFFMMRFEDFNNSPIEGLKYLTQWLGLQDYQYDLNNIPQAEQYEHDSVYRALVSHKTETKFKKLELSWPKMMTKEQSSLVIENNKWYYETFYPEIYSNYKVS